MPPAVPKPCGSWPRPHRFGGTLGSPVSPPSVAPSGGQLRQQRRGDSPSASPTQQPALIYGLTQSRGDFSSVFVLCCAVHASFFWGGEGGGGL